MKVGIAKSESFPINDPMVGRFKYFEGPAGRPSGRAAVVVKITADNGAVGWGQSVPVPKWSYETLASVHFTLTRYLTPARIGRDPFGSGLTDPDLSLAASLALYGAYDLRYPAALNGPRFFNANILKQPFEVKDGELAVPIGPGLGVEVDEAKTRELPVKDG